MSYKRTFKKTISVDYRGSHVVSFPPSESGGTKTAEYSGTAYEDVYVEIEVETDPFDRSVMNCNNRIGLLTDSVVAMNASQCKTVAENAELISNTIIDGFFQSLKSDISTQRMMLHQTVESRLMLLRQQQKTLLEKKAQMQKDYERTSARYEKIFTDLNNELSSRIHRLDQPVFDLVKEVEHDQARMLESNHIHTAVTHHRESGVAQAHLHSAKIKRDSTEAMAKIYKFLEDKAICDATLRSTTINGSGHDCYYVPALYMTTEAKGGYSESQCIFPKQYEEKEPVIVDMIKEQMSEKDYPDLTDSEKDQLKSYVQNEIRENLPGNDAHANRVKEMINKMLNKNLK